MHDGDAIVWALVDRAIRNAACGDNCLATGIRRMGVAHWLRVYEGQGIENKTQREHPL